jgi:hypothetical protein
VAAETESEASSGWKGLRDGAARLSLPIFVTVVSAVLIAYFVTSRQDAEHLQHQRDLQTKAVIADDMSKTASGLIFAAETRTKALVRGDKRRPSPDSTAKSLAEFYAASAFIGAKLQAYYKDQTLAKKWELYTNAVGAFLELGSVYPVNRQAKKKTFDGQKSQLEEIRKGLDGTNAALKRVDANNTLTEPNNRITYLNNYRLLGNALIKQGAELTREALNSP